MFSDLSVCGSFYTSGRCCAVFYVSDPHCANVPVWDVAPIFGDPDIELAGVLYGMTPSLLCGYVRNGFASRLAGHADLDPEDASAETLGGVRRIGTYNACDEPPAPAPARSPPQTPWEPPRPVPSFGTWPPPPCSRPDQLPPPTHAGAVISTTSPPNPPALPLLPQAPPLLPPAPTAATSALMAVALLLFFGCFGAVCFWCELRRRERVRPLAVSACGKDVGAGLRADGGAGSRRAQIWRAQVQPTASEGDVSGVRRLSVRPAASSSPLATRLSRLSRRLSSLGGPRLQCEELKCVCGEGAASDATAGEGWELNDAALQAVEHRASVIASEAAQPTSPCTAPAACPCACPADAADVSAGDTDRRYAMAAAGAESEPSGTEPGDPGTAGQHAPWRASIIDISDPSGRHSC